jgi:hypothetical protein
VPLFLAHEDVVVGIAIFHIKLSTPRLGSFICSSLILQGSWSDYLISYILYLLIGGTKRGTTLIREVKKLSSIQLIYKESVTVGWIIKRPIPWPANMSRPLPGLFTFPTTIEKKEKTERGLLPRFKSESRLLQGFARKCSHLTLCPTSNWLGKCWWRNWILLPMASLAASFGFCGSTIDRRQQTKLTLS